MDNWSTRIVRPIWNGPFYIGKLTPPVSVGDVLLKIMETIWRFLVVVLSLIVLAAFCIVAWIYVLEPTFFPPLKDQISVQASFDDGSQPIPPRITISPADAKGTSPAQFRCSPDFPLKIEFTNNSRVKVGKINFSVEGFEPGRTSNVLKNGGWREADAVIPAGYTWRSCWGVWLDEDVATSQLTYLVKIISAEEANPEIGNENLPSIPPPLPGPSTPADKAYTIPTPKAEPTLELATLKETDWQKIGMGCSCSFSVGNPSLEKLIAGGDGLTFFRLNGKEHLCPAPETQAMFDGPVSMSCGSTTLQVTPYGEVEPGFDGHSSKARLNIADASGTLSLTGTWGCSC